MAQESSTQAPLTRTMTIEQILNAYPHKGAMLAQELTNAGLHCVGCNAATWETLEAGVLGHGFSEEALERLLEKLNAIVLQEQDLSTIEMTPRAAQKYMAILAEEGKEGWGVRLDEKAAGCNGFEFVLDYSESPAEDDVVYESQGIQIHIRRSAEDRMLGTEIDFIDGLHGSGFKVSNPNVRSSCGCGTSHNY